MTLELDCKKIAEEQTNLSLSYQNLKEASEQIESTIVALKDRDFKDHKNLIDELKLEDDYKNDLKKDVINLVQEIECIPISHYNIQKNQFRLEFSDKG